MNRVRSEERSEFFSENRRYATRLPTAWGNCSHEHTGNT